MCVRLLGDNGVITETLPFSDLVNMRGVIANNGNGMATMTTLATNTQQQ